MSMQERPARPARPGRTRPVPTSDAGVDPVDYRPKITPAADQAAAPATEAPRIQVEERPKVDSSSASAAAQTQSNNKQAAPPAVGGPQATVQLGVNVHPDIAQLVARVKGSTGLSKRAIVEKALLETWGDKL